MTYAAPVLAPVEVAGSAVLLRSDDLDARELASWRRLAERAIEPNPFYDPAFVLAAAEASGRPADLLVVRDGDGWAACLPLERARHWRRLRLRALVPWRPDLCYLGTPLVDRYRIEEATDALAAFIADERRAAVVVIDPIGPSGPVGLGLQAGLAYRGRRPVVYSRWERAAVTRRLESTYVQDALSARRLKQIRRRWRSLEKELGAELAVRDRAADPAAWEDFLALESSGWKGRAGTALACSPEDAAFFRTLCESLAGDGRLQMLSLDAGGRTAAMQCNLFAGNRMFGFKVAFDDDLTRFGPGALLEVAAFDTFHHEAPALAIDSCAAPDNELVNRIWPDRIELQTLLVPTSAHRGALVRPAVRAEAVARAAVKRVRSATRRERT